MIQSADCGIQKPKNVRTIFFVAGWARPLAVEMSAIRVAQFSAQPLTF